MNFVLIFLIVIFSLSLFFYGRSKTRSISIQQNIKLNALPKFYGYYLVLWCSIPSLVFLLVWSLFEPVIIKSIIIETAANQGAIINDKNEANLIYEKIKAIYLGTYFGELDTILKESALSYAKFINLFTNSKIVLIFGIIIASVIYSLKKIKNNNKARDDVEVILKGLLFVSSLIAILTTMGIIFSLLFESIKFFSVINIFDYLFGTNWSPQRAFVSDASAITTAEYEELKEAKRIWRESINEIIKKNKRRPFTINYKNSNYTHLPARDAEITGKLQRSSIHANCSFIENWKSSDDYIYWDVDVLENGTKSVELYYTLPKESVGTEIALEFEDQIIKKTIDDFHDPSLEGFDKDKIKRIESYTKDFKKINIGELSFKKGISRLKLKTTIIKGNKSIDFRLLILKNKNEKSS